MDPTIVLDYFFNLFPFNQLCRPIQLRSVDFFCRIEWLVRVLSCPYSNRFYLWRSSLLLNSAWLSTNPDQTRLRKIYLLESSGLIWFSPFESKHNTNCPKFYFLDDTPPTQFLLTDGSDYGIGCYMGTKEQVRVIRFFRTSQRIAIELVWKS